jgi:NAD(P)H-dependent FMN reductase
MIYILSATNRPNSVTQKVALKTVEIFNFELKKSSSSLSAKLLDLSELKIDIFEQNAYAEKPEWFENNFQQPILKAKGLYVITPEYNGSFPGVMKYFIDMLKFPESLNDLPVAFTGIAAGQFGALRSVEQLEILFQYRKAHIFGERLFVPGVGNKIKDDGALEGLEDRQLEQIKGFIDFVSKLKV